jgi:hypothetical protein
MEHVKFRGLVPWQQVEIHGMVCKGEQKALWSCFHLSVAHQCYLLLLLVGLMQPIQTRSTNPQDTAYPTKAGSKSGGPKFESEQTLQKKYVG